MSERDHVQRLGGALGWGVVARIARMVLGLFGSVIVVRGLGTYDYGILAVLRTGLAFVAIVMGAGLTQGLLRYVPAWRLAGRRGRIRHMLAAVFGVQALLWLVLLGLFYLLRPWIGEIANPAVAGLLVLGVALLLPEVLGNTATQVANTHYDSRSVSFAVVISTLVYVGLVAWLLHAGARVAGVLVAAAVSNAVLAAWLLRRTPAYLAEARTEAEAGTEFRAEPGALPAAAAAAVPAGFSTVFRYSLPFLAIGLLNLITWRQSEVLFLGHFRGAAEAGFFDLAYRFPQMILEFVPGAIWPLVMAGFSEVYTRDRDALQRTSIAYYKLLFLLVAPLSLGGLLVGDLAIRILYPEFGPSGLICQVFFVIFSISFFSTPLSMVLYVVERPWIALVIYVVNASLNVGLDLALIPRFGLWGAVVPVSLVIVLSPFPYLWALRRLGIRLRIPWGFLLRIYVASGSMLLLWPLRSRVGGPGSFLVLVALGVGVFLVGLRLFRVLGPEERSLIHRVNPPAWGWLEPILSGRGSKGDR